MNTVTTGSVLRGRTPIEFYHWNFGITNNIVVHHKCTTRTLKVRSVRF
jgi:hypothetical protein